jgi:hypothetical protein
MIKALNKLGKLKGRSLDELRVRAAQALAALAERRGLSPHTRMPTDRALGRMLDPARVEGGAASAESLLAHFRSRQSPLFFAAFDDPDATRRELQRRFADSGAPEPVIERAARITRGQFDLLGFSRLSFGDPLDWHLEPRSGKRTPPVHWSRIDFLDADVAGDKKITWELNRHQYFMTLGRAYWRTRDELYARTFVAHLSAWMDANPPQVGINWASNLEVAFRSIAWLWALYFFKDSQHLTPALFTRALKFLYLHGRHLETYLSTYFSPNTHLTGEALGLFYLGTLLPELRRAAHWRATGKRILLAQLDRHVRPDGVYFEQSSYYHRYTTDFYTHLYILAQANGESFAPLLQTKLTALLDHLMGIMRPDGTTPFFGDDDGGRLAMLDERAPNDFRAALSTGAALFGRSDYKFLAAEPAEETLWLLGAAGLDAFDRLEARAPLSESRAFPDGGYYVMRDGWTRSSNYLLIDCGPHGADNCGHAHADALAFELAAQGRTLLVDPGTYTYTGAAAMRDYFRSAGAHNTLTVDGESSSLPAGPFRWKHIAHATTRRWISRPRFDYFEGAHDGYMRLDDPVGHSREVLFLKGDYWIMRDRVRGGGTHRYDLHFHFAAGASPFIDAEGETTQAAARERAPGVPGLEIFTFAGNGDWRVREGWVSSCYGERTAAPVCVFSAEAEGASEFITFLVPRDATQPAPHLRETEATGGRAFELEDEAGLDRLMIGGELETDRFASDFAWCWARFARHTNAWKELVLIDGRQLRLDDREIFKAASRIGYMTISHAGMDLKVETDARCEWTLQLPHTVRRLIVNDESLMVEGGSTVRFVEGQLRSEAAATLKAEALL